MVHIRGMYVCLVQMLCRERYLRWADPSSRGVVLSVYVSNWNLNNEMAEARVGLLRRKQNMNKKP